jgi:antitoxin HicB
MEYFARITKFGADFLVAFPEFPNINTYGTSLENALAEAREALNGTLETEFERGYTLPSPGKHGLKRSYHAIPVLPHVEIAYALKRMRNGHSQTEIARKLGITYQSYQKLENPRKCNPTVKTLERIGEVLGKELVITWK